MKGNRMRRIWESPSVVMQTQWNTSPVQVTDILLKAWSLRSRVTLAPAQVSLVPAWLTAVSAWLLRTHRLGKQHDS